MTTPLIEELARRGRTMTTVAAWAQSYLDHHWQTTWDRELRRIERAYERVGEPAYGIYGSALCRPIERELKVAGLTCVPGLPGSFELSEEAGSEWDRERRFWSVVCDVGVEALGTLVSSWFHDHTELRIPRPPTVVALGLTDPEAIRRAVGR